MKSRIAAIYLGVLFAPFGIFSLAWAFVYLTRAAYPSALVAVGFGVFALSFVAMLAIVTLHKTAPRVTFDDAGTTLRPDRNVDGLLVASTVAVFIAMAFYALFAAQDMIVIPMPTGSQRHYMYACIAGILVGLPSLWQIIKQRGMSHLRMTVDGLEVGGAVSTRRRTWDELTDVADRPRNGRQPSGTTYIMTADGHTRILPTDWYTPGGHTLRELVRFYWQHPESRDELTDGRAVRRLEARSRGAA